MTTEDDLCKGVKIYYRIFKDKLIDFKVTYDKLQASYNTVPKLMSNFESIHIRRKSWKKCIFFKIYIDSGFLYDNLVIVPYIYKNINNVYEYSYFFKYLYKNPIKYHFLCYYESLNLDKIIEYITNTENKLYFLD